MMLGMKKVCRVRIAKDELDKMSKEDLHKSWLLQEQYVDYIEEKLTENTDHLELVSLRESEEKLKHQQLEAIRKENILVMRLTTKEQEMQDYAGQIQELKQSQIPSMSQLRSALLDPAVNLMFDRMRREIDSLKARLEETQNELNAWKFTPDSVTGKRLMAKCRLLYQENEELGKMISSGKIAKLEGDLALQKSFSEEMKKSQTELDDFLLELDEDLEGLQSTVCYLQQQLRESKEQIQKLQKENEELSGMSNSSTFNHNHINNEDETEFMKSRVTQPCNAPSNNLSDAISSTPPASPNLNRTEEIVNPKSNNKGTNSEEPWFSPPSPPTPHNETIEKEVVLYDLKIESNAEIIAVRLPQKQQLPPSQVVKQEPTPIVDSSPITVPPSHGITIPAVRGSLHVEEYDSDQDTESSRTVDDDNILVNTTAEDVKNSQVRSVVSPVTKLNLGVEKAQLATNKRTSENCNNSPSIKGRKRTRGSKSVTAGIEEDGIRELPAVKRLRRRDIVVEHDVLESTDCKRTPMEIDNTDTEVEVAKALVNLAVAKKERKDIRTNSQDILTESLGNGELLKRKSTMENV